MVECDLTAAVTDTDVAAGPGLAEDALKAANPLAKIPALIRDDGPTLFDSRVICRYLDARADRGLYPETRLWEILTLEALADGMCDAAVLMVYEGRFRAPEQQNHSWVEAQWDRVSRSLDVLESRWGAHLAGPLDMGQIALISALGYLDFRHGERNWRDKRPSLAEWCAKQAERPSVRDTMPTP